MIREPITDISLPTGMKPSTRLFDGSEETFVNTDGIIEICRMTDTPQAKAIYRSFRKRLAEFRGSHPELSAEKQRSKAILAAISDAGWNMQTQTKLK